MRLIDADALCDDMYYWAFENDASYNESNPMAKWDSGLWIRYKMFENAIDDAPTIEPKRGEWIPCSERFPEEGIYVLATTSWDDITIAERWRENDWFISEGSCNAHDEDILAWKPLPEPWKGADDEQHKRVDKSCL